MSAPELQPGDQIVFTSLELTNKDDLAQATKDAGFVVGPGVSKKTALLVAGDPDVDSSKARKAREYGIAVVSEKDFVDTYLGGVVVPDTDLPTAPAPTGADAVQGTAKRDLPALKAASKTLRDGARFHALFQSTEHGRYIVRGPAFYSALGEAWTVGGIPVASSAGVPDKSLRGLALADGSEHAADADDFTALAVEQRPYGRFTVYGPVRTIAGGLRAVGPWLVRHGSPVEEG
ncbi:MAG: BRCT domain-containing protein [Arthrobacter sp.]|uniref:BRCT domain-containing protein n=1 Tax=Arthrobacter sp. TaxID=1667 RepID=UPI00348BBEF5